jgi:hypothetical protein
LNFTIICVGKLQICEEKQQEEKDVKENNLHVDLSSTLHEVV